VGRFATLVWPPAGIAIAALYFGGYRLLPAVALGAFITNLLSGAPLPAALFVAIGNSFEVCAGAYILHSPNAFNPLFRRLHDAIVFIATAAVAPLIAATIGAASLVATHVIVSDQFLLTWLAWWLGDALGILVLGAFLIRWIAKPFFHRTIRQWLQLAAAFAALGLANLIAVSNPLPAVSEIPILYFFIPFLFLALREGARAITLASLITASVMVWSTLHGIGIFADKTVPLSLFLVQLLIGTLTTIFLVIASTMEERRQTNIALERNLRDRERALLRVRRANQAKNEFIAILAHELRNPLAPIVNSLEILALEKEESLKHKQIRETMSASASTMRRLLDDLLDISRISRRGFKLQKERVDLVAIIRRSMKSAEIAIRSRGHTLLSFLPDEEVAVHADPMRIEQVIVNLLNNAAKYTPQPGTISIECMTEKKEAIVTITDTGIGISAERLAYIFDPFQEPEHPHMRREGIGIGLSLSSKLIKLHGGSIEAQSLGKGAGSTFTIHLPLSPSSQLSVSLEAKHTDFDHAATSFRILVIDDNVAAADSLGTLLAALGHTVKTADSGKEALALFGLFEPELAIVDIGLPDMDGYSIARTVREEGFDGTLIALTGYGQEEDKRAAYEAGFNHHLTKPASLADINVVLEKVAAGGR
jgi:signal transduction histidine kinase/CheY-like chemotaxis protein